MRYLLSTEALMDFVVGAKNLEQVLGGMRTTDAQISVISVAHYRAAIDASNLSAVDKRVHHSNLNSVLYQAKASQIMRDVDLEVAEKYAELRAMNLAANGNLLSSELLFVLATALRHSLILITPDQPWLPELRRLGLQVRIY